MPSRFTFTRRNMRAALVVSASVGLVSQALAETIVALRDGNELVTFDSATPAAVNAVAVTGLQLGDTLVGVDFRPANGLLYGITNQGRIYTIGSTGAATLISTSSVPLTGTAFGVDFNPVADRLRVVSDTDLNLRIDVTTGVATTDTAIVYAALDANSAANAVVSAAAYSDNAPGGATTTLYVIDPGANVLARQDPPNNGTLNTVGPLGVDATASGGFDISKTANNAYAALGVGVATGLYRIDLATGTATLVGPIGNGAAVRGISVAPEAPPVVAEFDVFAVTDAGALVTFKTTDPSALTTVGPVTGLQPSETIAGLDYRPQNGQLYALGSTGRLYTINTTTAAATEVGPLSLALAGTVFGVDFNPVADALRIVSVDDQNLRADPDNGAVTPDANVAYETGDAHQGQSPSIAALAYTNNESGAIATQLYAIDSAFDTLALQDPPNNGTLETIGPLGVDTGDRTSFDIAGEDDSAFAAITPTSGVTSLYTVNLTTGAATLVAQVGTGVSLRAMALAPLDTTPGGEGDLVVTQVVLHFNFKSANKDKFMVKGTLPALTGATTGTVVNVDIGGATQTFTLDRKGRARVGGDTFALIGRPKNGRIKFEVQLKKGDFSDEMVDEDMDGTETVKKVPREIDISIDVGDEVNSDTVDVVYTAKAGKTGIAKRNPDQSDDE